MHGDTTDGGTGRTRPWYFWAIIAFVVGLLFGWLVIGWAAWPVTWRNALPQDLRAEQKYDYLTMVAESYAANGDLALAKSRVAGWPPEDLAASFSAVQEQYASTNASIASDVQLLASALSVSQGAGQAQAPARAPTAIPAQSGARSRSGAANALTTLLWIILVVGAIAFFAYLFLRWRAAQQGRPAPDIRESLRTFGRRGMAEETAAQVAEEEKARWSSPTTETPVYPAYEDQDIVDHTPSDYDRGEAPRTYPRGSGTDQPDLLPEDVPGERDIAPQQPREGSRPPVIYPASNEEWTTTEPRRTSAAPAAVPASVSAGTPAGGKLGDFVAIYETGESDYDEAFDINDPVDGLIGQCGLQLNEPVGRNRDQAVALQAWLWDSSDPDTRVKVLMSEGAYRDTALRAQQVTEHDAFPVRTGTEFELESHDLLMKARVEKVDYADQEPSRSVFAQIQVRMQIFRKS